MVFFLPEEEKRSCDEQRERLGNGDGEPDAVDAEKFRQDQNGGDLNDERAQERDERAGRAVVEPCEKRRAEDVEAADEEREGIDAQRIDRHVAELCVVADENVGDGPGKQNGGSCHGKAREERNGQAFFEQALELRVVLRAVVIADDRRDRDGVAKEKGHEDEADIHQNTVGADAVFLRDGHETDVVEYADE